MNAVNMEAFAVGNVPAGEDWLDSIPPNDGADQPQPETSNDNAAGWDLTDPEQVKLKAQYDAHIEGEREKRKARREREDNATAQSGSATSQAALKLFPLVMAANIKFDLESEDLIDGILPKVGVVMLFGKPGTFKSFVAVDWHMSTTKGGTWAGRRVEQGASVYIAAEGAGGATKRFEGYVKRHGLPKDAPFAMIPVAPNLGNEKGDVEKIIATIEASKLKPKLITIDTASQSLGSGDENGTGMQTLLNNAKALALHFECCVLIVHHVGVAEGADKRPRGFSASGGNVEALILCERKDKAMQSTLTIDKLKDEPDGVHFVVDLERVEIGTNKRGKVHSTLVVCAAAETEKTAEAKPAKSPPAQKRLLTDVVAQAIDEAGFDLRPFSDGPMVRAADDEIVRLRYYTRIAEAGKPDETPEARAERQRKAFNRAIKAMLDAKLIAAQERDGRRLLWLA